MRRDWTWFLGSLLILGGVWGLMIACQSDTPVASTPPTLEAAPEGSAGAPAQVTSNAWESNGLKVTIIGDEWGSGSCHDNGGTRTFLIENVGDVERYSNLAAYTDDDLVCATQKTVTGKPTHDGCTSVKPGEACTYSITVQTPKCGSLQADDCWGPGGIQGCAFVAGDSFKSKEVCDVCAETEPVTSYTKWGECNDTLPADQAPGCWECRTKTVKECEKDPVITPETREVECECVENGPYTKCDDWNECHEHPDTELCFREQSCQRSWDCKDPEPFENVEECACPQCVEEGPYVGEVVWSGVVLKGACPQTFGTSERCHELGKQTTTWDCKPDLTVDACRPADCPDECVIPPEGTTQTWSGKGDPDTECEAFGPYEATWRDPDFYICKAGNDRIVEYSTPGWKCDNGKDRSHTTKCRCIE